MEEMNFLRIHNRSYQLPRLHHQSPLCNTPPLPLNAKIEPYQLFDHFVIDSLSLSKPTFKFSGVRRISASVVHGREEERREERQSEEGYSSNGSEMDYLAPDGDVYLNTLRLVECSMFAAVTGLVYFLSNSLSIENYFGCFFALPIVISSLRWGVAAGRKTMVATAMLLFVLSGPVKSLTYLDDWSSTPFVVEQKAAGRFLTRLIFSTADSWHSWFDNGLFVEARATGAMGYVFTSSFLIRENILALITVNIHASLSYVFAATGINIIPSMNFIYTLFGILVLLNSGFFVFLLHLLYSVFLTRLGNEEFVEIASMA